MGTCDFIFTNYILCMVDYKAKAGKKVEKFFRYFRLSSEMLYKRVHKILIDKINSLYFKVKYKLGFRKIENSIKIQNV